MSKHSFVIYACLILSLGLISFSTFQFRTIHSIEKSAGPPACYAGEPPANLTCSIPACHNSFPLNSGTATVGLDLGLAAGGYVPGNTYTITTSVAKAGMIRSGFELIALEDNNDQISPGVVTLIDTIRTQTIDSLHPHNGPCGNYPKRVYVQHRLPGITSATPGSNSWSFIWTAPQTNVGTITFYSAYVESNNDQTELNDYVYTANKSISALSGVASFGINSHLIKVYPNPSGGNFDISLEAINTGPTDALLSIYSSVGQVVYRNELKRFNGSASIELHEIHSGLYYLKLEVGAESFVKKILIR